MKKIIIATGFSALLIGCTACSPTGSTTDKILKEVTATCKSIDEVNKVGIDILKSDPTKKDLVAKLRKVTIQADPICKNLASKEVSPAELTNVQGVLHQADAIYKLIQGVK